MGDTNIEWADRVWNVVRGCSRVSAGCTGCYAERQAIRHAGPGGHYEGLVSAHPKPDGRREPRWTGEVRFVPEKLHEPLSWKSGRVFVNSMSDLFHEGLAFEHIAAVFGVMAACPRLDFLVLTKRPERAREFFAQPDIRERVDFFRHVTLAGRIEEFFAEERVAPVDGWPGYWITSRGRVLSDNKGERREMRPMAGDAGHQRVMLYRDGETARPLVHRLVLAAFDGAQPESAQGCHIDGNPRNNALWNLRWGTQAENWSDSKRHGTARRYSKLSPEQVADLRRLSAEGASGAELGRRFGISGTQARNTASGRQWPAPPPALEWPLPGVWLGVSVEDQKTADERIPLLLETPAALRWVSYEPALGPVDFDLPRCDDCGEAADSRTDDGMPWCTEHERECSYGHWLDFLTDGSFGEPAGYPANDGIGWVVVGGESGPRARPFDLAWARSVIEQCREAGTPCFVKQLGARPVGAWVDVDGVTREPPRLDDRKGGASVEWPFDLRVREWPEVRHVP